MPNNNQRDSAAQHDRNVRHDEKEATLINTLSLGMKIMKAILLFSITQPSQMHSKELWIMKKWTRGILQKNNYNVFGRW